MPKIDLPFLALGSGEERGLQSSLTSGKFRCNMMMVTDPGQALAILREASGPGGGPDLILAYGGLADGRSARFAVGLRADAALGASTVIAVVDDADAREAFADHPDARSVLLGEFPAERVSALLAKPRFWWVMARFS